MTRRGTRRRKSPAASRRLPAELAIYRADHARHRLPRLFARTDLVMLGLGVMIGAGIFKLAAAQAAANAGPAVILSFLLAAFVCLLAALSFAELSSALPIAGSAYTFSYVIFGELWAWLVGWALVLELVLAAAVVARAWAEYVLALLGGPGWLEPYAEFGSSFNIVAVLVVLLLTALVVTGTKLSARLIRTVVIAKVAVILFVIALGVFLVDLGNFTPFIPEPQAAAPSGGSASTIFERLTGNEGQRFGLFGVFASAGVITFSFIGFDLIATAAEDAQEPRRSLPSGILRSVGIVTVLYVLMALVIVGMRPYTQLGGPAPVSGAFAAAGLDWAAGIINLGALLAMTTVVMVVLIGLSRVLFAMARDGLLPAGLARVSRTFSSPARAAATAGAAAAGVSLYPDVGALQETLVLGALFAFLFCSVGVLVARRTQPGLQRGFRVPGVPVVPLLAVCSIGWLMLNLHVTTWRNFGIWMAVGLLGYLLYGRRRSRLGRGEDLPAPSDGTEALTRLSSQQHGSGS